MQDPTTDKVASSPFAELRQPVSRERGLDRVLQLLDFLHAHSQPIALADLARAMQAPRSTIYALAKSLLDAGLLEMADGRVYFGRMIYLYGMDYMRENPLVRRGRAAVEELSKETGETAELCALQNGRYTIIHMCAGARPFRISSAVGLQIPLPWTASGRLLLSGLDPASVEALVSAEDLVLPDGRTIAFDAFITAIAEARRLGYCVTKGLVDAFTMCLAAPIYAASGTVEATLCLVVPIDTPDADRDKLLSILQARAGRLSMRADAAHPLEPVSA